MIMGQILYQTDTSPKKKKQNTQIWREQKIQSIQTQNHQLDKNRSNKGRKYRLPQIPRERENIRIGSNHSSNMVTIVKSQYQMAFDSLKPSFLVEVRWCKMVLGIDWWYHVHVYCFFEFRRWLKYDSSGLKI